MFSKKNLFELLAIVLVSLGGFSTLDAAYFKSDFFPIGLTGLNKAGGWWVPYDTTWAYERGLIESLGVNCIGSEDAWHNYLIDFAGNRARTRTYLDSVCIKLADDGNTDTVYLITASYGAKSRYYKFYEAIDTMEKYREYHSCEGVDCNWHYHALDSPSDCITPDSCEGGGTEKSNKRACAFFRSVHRPTQAGVGSMLFAPYGWSPHGTHTNNWNTFDGDDRWREMADEAVSSFGLYFADTNHADHAKYIWGYNLITEDGGMYRNCDSDNPWQGQWAAVDRIFNGGRTIYKGYIPSWDSATHNGIRGVEDALGGKDEAFEDGNRTIIAKGGTWPLHKGNINIFEELPDVDAFVVYSETWCRAKYNYGEQVIFDAMLYEDSSVAENIRKGHPGRGVKSGYHNTAIYFQRYGNTNPRSGQKRRWIPGIGTKWSEVNSSGTRAFSRRPCPPELRCAVYLCLSRGAKGILFHPWLTYYSSANIDDIPGNIQIPCSQENGEYTIGLRDCDGYPFGHPDADTHKLNGGAPNAPYWANADDTTYTYLKTLVKEIKKIAPKLMELDWVNAYSLMSTSPEWRSPCPHYYMEDVWGAEFMDLAFFDHPYEPVGVEYFMMVNREGIADMTNRNVGVALDAGHWPESDTLILTDIANPDNPRKLKRVGERFTFTEVFEPGEGKLYRAAPVNEAPIVLVPSSEGGVR